MCKHILRMMVIAWLLAAGAAVQADIINIDVSYKVVLNPANGQRPPGPTGGAITDAQIQQGLDGANALLETYWRGYRFRRIGSIRNVGGLNDNTGPSRWYNTNFFDDDNGSAWKDQMEAAAKASPATYRWDGDDINIYIANGKCGGICSFPGDDILIIGACGGAANSGSLTLHEIGHYFDLCHTQGCPCGSCDGTKTGQCHTTPGNDEMPDTLPDLQCWSRNQIAQWSYSQNYSNLSASRKNLVDNVFLNVMSYHSNTTRLTEKQLDRWADLGNGDRSGVTHGRTRFVDRNAGIFQFGTSVFPFDTVSEGVNAADNGDIVLLRPGGYNQTMTISKPLCLRVTRTGAANIGSSSNPGSPAAAPVGVFESLWDVPGLSPDLPEVRIDFPGTNAN